MTKLEEGLTFRIIPRGNLNSKLQNVSFRAFCSSRQQTVDDLSMDIRQPEVAACKPVGELGVFDAQQAEDRRVIIVDVDGVADDVVAEVIGLPVSDSGFYSAAG